jgi:PilZ domain
MGTGLALPVATRELKDTMFPTNQNPMTTGDRRTRLRFPLDMEVRFQFSWFNRRNPTRGRGKVEDISSHALAFHTDEPPKPGSRLAVSIAWPAKRDDCSLRLVFEGRVLRASGDLVVVTIQRPEFHTARKEQHGRP